MPVGTQATVKGMTPDELEELGARLSCAIRTTYTCAPGRSGRRGGGAALVHGVVRANLTDSGGFQVFSLAGLRRIEEEGVWFRSHLDGSSHFIGPKESIAIQEALGADIIMAFDECPPYPSKSYVEEAVLGRPHGLRSV